MRQKGKDAFAANDLHRAMVYYERALTLLGTNREGQVSCGLHCRRSMHFSKPPWLILKPGVLASSFQELPEDAQLRHACAPLFSNLGIILMKVCSKVYLNIAPLFWAQS